MASKRILRRELIHDMWIEKLVSAQCSTGNGALYISQASEIPGWFKREELGLDMRNGPSVFYTADNVNQIRHDNLAVFHESERPKVVHEAAEKNRRVNARKESVRRRRRMHHQLRSALISRKAA